MPDIIQYINLNFIINMLKLFFENMYKTIFNYYLNMDGHKSFAYHISSLLCGGFLFLFVLNILAILNIIQHADYIKNYGKIFNMVLFAIVSYIVNIILFQVLKIDKYSDNTDNLFIIPKETIRSIWTIYIINFLLFFALALIRKYINTH